MYIRKWSKGFLHFLIIFYVNANIVDTTLFTMYFQY